MMGYWEFWCVIHEGLLFDHGFREFRNEQSRIDTRLIDHW